MFSRHSFFLVKVIAYVCTRQLYRYMYVYLYASMYLYMNQDTHTNIHHTIQYTTYSRYDSVSQCLLVFSKIPNSVILSDALWSNVFTLGSKYFQNSKGPFIPKRT